jgi:hypothetical protein
MLHLYYSQEYPNHTLYHNVPFGIIKFVIPVVFNKLIRVECIFLSNTTLFYLMVEVYLHLLPKVQLHILALDNSHIQVVHESLESSYTRVTMGCVQWGCGR